jgi:formylglycine-generating enzyme required for sulfatase activity
MALKLLHRTLKAQFYPEVLSDDVNLDMVFIKGGTFTMGSPEDELERRDDEGPQHEVTVPDLFMGKYQVTQEQWQVVAGYPQVSIALKPNPSQFESKNLPVEQVSWYEVVEFCDRLSKHSGRTYSLPSEAQWSSLALCSFALLFFALSTSCETRSFFIPIHLSAIATFAGTRSIFPWLGRSGPFWIGGGAIDPQRVLP